jgi:multidrug resistance efflux pump
MQIVSNPRPLAKWKQVYQAALFELDPTRLQSKLEAAETALEDRLLEVSSRGSIGQRERMELEDAKRTIRLLAKQESRA